MGKEIKIALIIKTDGLEYDDRIRKEILSIEKLYPNIKFKIFALLANNKEEEGITDYGIPYKSIYLKERDKYPSQKKALLKAYRFYKKVKKETKEYDIIWASNVDSSFFPLLYKGKTLIWDLHELPERFLKNIFTKKLLKHIFNNCDAVIHANPQRIDYLKSIGIIKNFTKHHSIRNYPNFDEIDKNYDQKFKDFINWKGNRKCIYLQSLANDSRAPYESIVSILRIPQFTAVITGNYFNNAYLKLINEFGEDEIKNRLFFAGKIPQLKIPQYMKECYMSLVFYKNSKPNNFYCEANRFYQSIIMGLPVVVGNNPSMRELIEKYGFGESINDDGNNVDLIIDGIKKINENHETYIQNIEKNKNKLLWENQVSELRKIIDTIIN